MPRGQLATRSRQEVLQDRVYRVLFDRIQQAARQVSHMCSDGWTVEEVGKRVTRYCSRAAADPELAQLTSWEPICVELIDKAMQTYAAACSEMPWFQYIDLTPAFYEAVLEFMAFHGRGNAPANSVVYEKTQMEFFDKLDRLCLDRAVWEAVTQTVVHDKLRAKLARSLLLTHWACFDRVMIASGLHVEACKLSPERQFKLLEDFVVDWLEEALGRAHQSFINAEVEVNAELLEDFLRALIAPWDADHPFGSYSCLPAALFMKLGRPPHDWAFIQEAAATLSASFNRTEQAGAVRTGRKRARRTEQHGNGAQRRRADSTDVAAGAAGHPLCFLAEDCGGSEASRCVRHVQSNGENGDLYCEVCWNTFCENNDSLRGVYEDQ